jgi:hypothetical protein
MSGYLLIERWFSRDALFGVKCRWKRGCRSSQAAPADTLITRVSPSG